MKKVVMFFVDLFRKAKHYISTFLLKCQLVEVWRQCGSCQNNQNLSTGKGVCWA